MTLMSDPVPSAQLDRAKIPTNLTTRHHAVHRWFNFIAGFSPEFVEQCVRNAGLGPGAVLLDPFGGLATSLVAANALGLDAVGYEAHPFFYDVAQAKLDARVIDQLDEVHTLLADVDPSAVRLEGEWSESALTYLLKLIEPSQLAFLAAARKRLNECPERSRSLYRLVLSNVLERVAGAATDGIYKAPTTKKRAVEYGEALARATMLIQDDLNFTYFGDDGSSKFHNQSSESMSLTVDESVDICVTSPPYLNNFDFAEMTRMELYFWGYAGSWGEITQTVRTRLIVNTTTAPATLKNNPRWFDSLSTPFQQQVQPLQIALHEAMKTRGGKKDYHKLVYPYFAQMADVIRETRRVLKPGSSFHMVVADAALYGVHIHTEELLAELMTESGFTIREIERLRDRGERWVLKKRDGPQGTLGEFHIHAVKKLTR